MSGKSTYLKQIGLLTVQAMIGCLWVEDSNTISLHELTGPLFTFSVPAEYACFILHDSLLSRLSNDGKEQANIIVWLHLLKSCRFNGEMSVNLCLRNGCVSHDTG